MQSTDFDHFSYVAFKEIPSLHNTNDSINFGKNVNYRFLIGYREIWYAVGSVWGTFIIILLVPRLNKVPIDATLRKWSKISRLHL